MFCKRYNELVPLEKKSLYDVILNASFIKYQQRYSNCSCDIQMKEKIVFYCPDNFHENQISLLQNGNV